MAGAVGRDAEGHAALGSWHDQIFGLRSSSRPGAQSQTHVSTRRSDAWQRSLASLAALGPGPNPHGGDYCPPNRVARLVVPRLRPAQVSGGWAHVDLAHVEQ